jgi:non-ribosomal peptide synthetase component F
MTYGPESWTYEQLHHDVRAVCARLDLRPGQPVGLFVGPDVGTRVLYLAVVLSGGVVVPVSRTWPAKRVTMVLTALGANTILFSERPHIAAEDGWTDGHLAPGYGARRPVAACEGGWPPIGVGSDALYVLHTSGSTGMPKGVPIRQRSVLAYLDYVIDRYEVTEEARFSATFELSFDLAVHDLFVPLLSGASVHLPVGREYLLPAQYVARTAQTHWYSVPSVVSTAAALKQLPAGSMPGLRWSLFGGEQLMLSQAEAWRAAAPGSTIENLYGPTELTLTCSQYRLPADRGQWPETVNGSVPIGTVYPHLRWRIGSARDGDELLVDGVQRFDGYMAPADDIDAFEDDGAGDRWYRTGDRVSLLDGQLLHRGRLDRQIKAGGMRIELDEVEGAYRRCSAVTGAAAITVTDRVGLSIIMYLTGDERQRAAIEAQAAAELPTYMRPERMIWLDEFPLNDNGKVDYRALARRNDAAA